MTFEQWWETLKNKPIPQLKPDFAGCWNAALAAAASSDLKIDFVVPAECTPGVADACLRGVNRSMRDAIRALRVTP